MVDRRDRLAHWTDGAVFASSGRSRLPHDSQPDDLGQGHRNEAEGAADQHVGDTLLRDAAGAAGTGGGERNEEAAQAKVTT